MTPDLSREIAYLFNVGNVPVDTRIAVIEALKANKKMTSIDQLPPRLAAVLNYIKETHPKEQ